MSGADVVAEQVRTVYRQSRVVLLANCINALIVSALSWGSVPHAWIYAWVGAMAAVTTARTVLSHRYQRTPPPASQARRWGARFVLGSAAAGTLWGIAGLSFIDPGAPMSQLCVMFFVGGMCSAAAGTLAAYLPSFVAFMVPALAGLALGVSSIGGALHNTLAGVVALYGVGLFVVAKVNHRALSRAFSLSFENTGLLATLSETRRRLEDGNRTLEQRVAERSDALRKQSEALRDAQRLEAIGRLAGGVAHDFNNLLTIILANISELDEQVGLDARTRAALREMNEAGSKGADLVRQLLTFSRRQRTTPTTLDLNATLRSMDRLLSRLLGEGLTLELDLRSTPLFVHMDPTQTEQIIINLITNARDAMPAGGVVRLETQTVQLTERLAALEPGRYALLGVSDTGTGMDEETQARIFEPFFTTKEPGKGTGLGLSTAYGIVEQSHGHIAVRSQPGLGSSFQVYLPLANAPAELISDPHGRRVSGLRPAARAQRATTVLLVEDDPTVRAVTRRILEHAGHHVLTSPGAERALEIAAEHGTEIELLVTDVVMAGMGGPTLASRLRATHPTLKTLFISGYSRDHVMPADEPHQVSFLAKPFTRDMLLAKVAELVATPRDVRSSALGER
jgi:signal transduction histidine kinase/ActR/RegA family two-component response regulator